jgi:hypothetical protein
MISLQLRSMLFFMISVIVIYGFINITNFATCQYKTTFDIISLKVYKSVGANIKRRQKSFLWNRQKNSGNPNSIVVNLNMLCGCKEKWNELEY